MIRIIAKYDYINKYKQFVPKVFSTYAAPTVLGLLPPIYST